MHIKMATIQALLSAPHPPGDAAAIFIYVNDIELDFVLNVNVNLYTQIDPFIFAQVNKTLVLCLFRCKHCLRL